MLTYNNMLTYKTIIPSPHKSIKVLFNRITVYVIAVAVGGKQ